MVPMALSSTVSIIDIAAIPLPVRATSMEMALTISLWELPALLW